MMRPAAKRTVDARIAAVDVIRVFIFLTLPGAGYFTFPTTTAAIVCWGLVSTSVEGVVRLSNEAFTNVAAANNAAATMTEVRFASRCAMSGFLCRVLLFKIRVLVLKVHGLTVKSPVLNTSFPISYA